MLTWFSVETSLLLYIRKEKSILYKGYRDTLLCKLRSTQRRQEEDCETRGHGDLHEWEEKGWGGRYVIASCLVLTLVSKRA